MKKGFFQLSLLLAISFSALQVFASEMKSIDFTQNGEISNLEILLDKEGVKVNKFHITEDKQVIIDLKDVEAS